VPRDDKASTLAVLDSLATLQDSICPPRASHGQCFVGLVSQQLVNPYGDLYLEYLERLARHTSALTALRIGIEIRRDGRCPTAEQLASPRYTALRSPAVLGDSVRVTLDAGSLTVRPPVWADDRKHSWTIRCP
jgi:hypothetical protein